MYKKLFLSLWFCFLSVILMAQGEPTTKQWMPSLGIQWTTGITWDQIKQKAKAENKYIFVDCYATWCGPCKKMDKEVYTDSIVASFFNSEFISVKIQMDQTNKDDDNVKAWYSDAELVGRKYKVTAYPSFLFLAPDGRIIEKEIGYKTTEEFVKLGQSVLVPGKVYDDPYAEYDRLINEYNKGNKDYSKMPYLVKTSQYIGERETARAIGKDYTNYLLSLSDDKLYTKGNIEFLTSTYAIGSKSKIFKLFYPDGRKVDSIMNKKGFAMSVVDKTIQRELVDSFTHTKSDGWQIIDQTQKYPEIDWAQLDNIIKMKYNSTYADRNVLDGKIRWYRFKDENLFVNNFIERMKKYGSDTTDDDVDGNINDCAYIIFQKRNDKSQIHLAIQWMEGVLKRHPSDHLYIDTYASLIYKSGKKKNGLKWEEKALAIASAKPADEVYPSDIELFKKQIEGMKKGAKIWLEQKQ